MLMGFINHAPSFLRSLVSKTRFLFLYVRRQQSNWKIITLTLAPPLSTSSENALNMKYDTRVCGHRSDGCEMWREVVFLKALD